MDKPLLSINNVSKRFGDLEILKEIQLDLYKGQSLAILGPSGAGKSTLLHLAGLMEKPTFGEVFIEGQDTSTISESDRARVRLESVGFLFQFHHLLPDFNVLENVLMPARLAGDDLENREREARHILERLGLTARLTHRPFQLSGGEQQRAALARALIRKPKLLLCDEPTGNLDIGNAGEVITLIWSEVRSAGVGTIIVTHNEKLAQQTEQIFYLNAGFLSKKPEEKIS